MGRQESIVLELQRLATDKSNDITDLLRKALLVASKLKLEDFRNWICNELNGYSQGDVPDYRKCSARIKLDNPFHGLVPYMFLNKETENTFCQIEIRDPVGSLADALTKSGGASHLLHPLSPAETRYFVDQQDGPCQLPPVRIIAPNTLAFAIDAVRTTILEWALKLEGEGVFGENLMFSREEQEKAAASTGIQITYFQGILGDVKDSKIEQDLHMAIAKRDFEGLTDYLRSIGLEDQDLEELKEAIDADPPIETPGQFGKRVGTWIGKMVGKAASGAWHVGIEAAGNLLAKAISSYYGM